MTNEQEPHDANEGMGGTSELTAGLGARLQQAMIEKIFPSELLDKPDVNLVRVFVKAKAGTHKIYSSEFMEVKRG